MHWMRLFFTSDRRFRRLMRLYLAERMAATLTDRLLILHMRLEAKRKRAFKEYAKSDKTIRKLFNL